MDDPVLMACTCDDCNRPPAHFGARKVLMISIYGSLAWSLPALLAYLGSMVR